MATPLEIADIVNRLVAELGGEREKLSSATSKLFNTLNANEKQTVTNALRERLAAGSQAFQLRRDGAKVQGQLRVLDRKAQISEERRTAPARIKEHERTVTIRKSEATSAIRRARGISGSPGEVRQALTLFSQVDPEGARILGDDFSRNPGSRIVSRNPSIRALREVASEARVNTLGFPTGPSRAPSIPGISTGRELAVRPSTQRTIRFDEGKLERLAQKSFRGKLGKGALIGGAALAIPLILSAISGEKKQEQLDPAAQFQLLQALGAQQGGGRGIDPDLQTGRQLRNVLSLLNVIKSITGMQSVMAQPGAGIV